MMNRKNFLFLIVALFVCTLSAFGSLPTPTLSTPSNGAVSQNPNVTLYWSSVSGATRYEYKLSTNSQMLNATVGSVSSSYSSTSTSNLLFGMTYYWQVRALKTSTPADSSSWSAIRSFTVTNSPITLSTPSNGATNVNPNVTLYWSSQNGITYYDYQVDVSPNFNSSTLISGSRSSSYASVTMSNLLFGTTYYWRVRARHSADTLAWSTVRSFTVTNTPITLSTPSNGATNVNPNVTLYWSSQDGINYYDYQVDVTPSFNSPQLISGSRSSSYASVTMSNLLFGTTYYWRVRARHSADTLTWSTVRNFTVTNNPITLSTPSNGATNVNPNVTLYWSSQNGINYYDYQVDISPSFNSPQLISGSRSSSYASVTMSNLLFGTTYYWRVRARHSADTLAWSTSRSFTVTQNPIVLSSPSNGATNVNPNVTLYWSSQNGINYYDYQYDTTPNFNSPLLVSSSRTSSYNSVTTSNLRFGMTYYWRVRARHSADTLAWSTVWHFTVTNNPILLSSPSNNSINQAINVTLYWSSLNGINYYDYQLDTTPNFNSPILISTSRPSSYNSASTSNLLFGKTYYWRVRARHSADTTQWSATWNFTTILTQPTLSSPSNGALNQDPNVTLYWNSFSGISYYEYELDTTPNFNSPILISASRPGSYSYVSTSNLLFGKTYYWRMRARNTNDVTQWSAVWHFTVTNGPITLSSPSNGVVNQDPNVTLYWNSQNGINYYDYQLDTTPNFNSPLLVSTSRPSSYSSVSTSNLLFGKTYYWRVRCRHSADTMQWSAIRSFTTTANAITLSSPSNGATNVMTNVTLYWNSMNGINYYDYQLDTTPNFNSPLLISTSRPSSYNSVNTSNLLFGKTYYWRVRARHSADTTQWSTVWRFTTMLTQPTLSSPANGTVNIAPNVTLYWNSFNGVTDYDYEYDTTPNFNSPLLVSSSRTGSYSSVSTSNLLFGTTYYWRVRARNSSDITAWSAVWSFTTLTGPITLSTPSNGAMNQNANVTLYWNSVNGITYYDYQYDTTANFNSPLLTSSSRTSSYSSVSSSNLRFGTTYYWRVRARHSADTMSWSAIRSFTTLDGLTLSSPANGATNIATNPTLYWNSLNGVINYEYQCDVTPQFNSGLLISGSRTSSYSYYALSNLTFGTTYYWRVRARHAADTTQWSTVWSFTTPYQMASAPNLLSPANQSSNIPCLGTTLSWSSAPGANYYEIMMADNPNFTNPSVDTTSSLSLFTGSLPCLTTLYWRVRGADNFGYTPWSAVWSFTTNNTQIPDTLDAPILVSPGNLSTYIPWTGTMLIWNTVQDATFYEYEYADNPNFTNSFTGRTSGLSYFTDTLDMNTTYYWHVRAGNGTDYSPWSVVWSFTTDSLIPSNPLTAPTLISPQDLTINVPYSGATLFWSAVPQATFYEYQYADNAGFANATVGTTTATSYFTDTLSMNTTYYWQVRAGNGTDYSPWSVIWSFTTDSLIPINPLTAPTLISPQDLTINVPYAGATLQWSVVSQATFYEYQYADNAGFANAIVGTTTATSYFTDTLSMNTTYYWHVRAGNGTDYSPWSVVWSFTTDSLIPSNPLTAPTLISPQDLTINVPYSGATLQWSVVSQATFYEYQYADNAGFANATVGTTTATSYFTGTLAMDTTYYWQVRAGNGTDYSPWSVVWSFSTDSLIPSNPLTAPTLISPQDLTINVPYSGATLQWSVVSQATFYEYQYADNAGFANAIVGTTTATSYFTGALAMDTTYYWKVRAGNGTDYSSWSEVWSFTTDFASGIHDADISNITLYPNPASQQVTLNNESGWDGISQIKIVDMLGREILNMVPASSNQIQIEVSSWQAGLYYVIVQESKRKIALPLVINN